MESIGGVVCVGWCWKEDWGSWEKSKRSEGIREKASRFYKKESEIASYVSFAASLNLFWFGDRAKKKVHIAYIACIDFPLKKHKCLRIKMPKTIQENALTSLPTPTPIQTALDLHYPSAVFTLYCRWTSSKWPYSSVLELMLCTQLVLGISS